MILAPYLKCSSVRPSSSVGWSFGVGFPKRGRDVALPYSFHECVADTVSFGECNEYDQPLVM